MRRGNRLFYMFAEHAASDPKSVPKSQLAQFQRAVRAGNGILQYVWAKDADHARKMLLKGQGDKFSGFLLAGIKLSCQEFDKTGKLCRRYATTPGAKCVSSPPPSPLPRKRKPKPPEAATSWCSNWEVIEENRVDREGEKYLHERQYCLEYSPNCLNPGISLKKEKEQITKSKVTSKIIETTTPDVYETAWKLPDREFNQFEKSYGYERGVSKFASDKKRDITKKHGIDWYDIKKHDLTLKEYVETERRAYTSTMGKSGEYPLDLAIEEHRNIIEDALKRGEAIRPEVIIDYPDLKPVITPEQKVQNEIYFEPSHGRASYKEGFTRPNFENLEPWQMTAYEWERAVEKTKPETVQTRATKSSGAEMNRRYVERQRLNYGVPQEYDPDAEWYKHITHKDIVLKAIDEGKVIHPLVIEDYPELKKEIPAPETPGTIPAYLTDKPFTKEQIDDCNRFSHYTIDPNVEFMKEINNLAVKTLEGLKEYGYTEMPINAQAEIGDYRKALYNYNLTHWRNISYHPGSAIVGASKYPTKRRDIYNTRETANWGRLQKAKESFEKVIKDLRIHADPMFLILKKLGTAINYLPDAVKMDRLNFGKLMEKKYTEQYQNKSYDAEFVRKKGRELHEQLINIAIQRGEKIEYDALKDYPKHLSSAREKNLLENEPEAKSIKQTEYKLNPNILKVYLNKVVAEQKSFAMKAKYSKYIGFDPQAEYDDSVARVSANMDDMFKKAGFAGPTPEAINEFEKYKKAYSDYLNEAMMLTLTYSHPDSLGPALVDRKYKMNLKEDRFKKIVDTILKGKPGSTGASQVLTAKDVSEILSNQPLNKDITPGKLWEQWIASATFQKMDVPVEMIGMATEPQPGALPVTQGPIIVELNINELGRIRSEFGTHGKPPDVLVIDGKHRLALAIKTGQRTIEAYVGNKAVKFVNRESKKFEAKKQEMIKALAHFVENPSGGTLREVEVNFTPDEVKFIRTLGRKPLDEIKQSLNLGDLGDREVRNIYGNIKDGIVQAVILAAKKRKKQYIPFRYASQAYSMRIPISEYVPMYDNYYEISPNADVKKWIKTIDGWRTETVPLDFYTSQRIRERIERIELPEPEERGIQPALFGAMDKSGKYEMGERYLYLAEASKEPWEIFINRDRKKNIKLFGQQVLHYPVYDDRGAFWQWMSAKYYREEINAGRLKKIAGKALKYPGEQLPLFGDYGGLYTNCAVWQEVETLDKDYIFRCLLHARACLPEGAACVPGLGTRACIKLKNVPAISKIFHKKTIKRCKKYAPTCTEGKSCLPEKMPKPVREYPRRSEIISYAKSLAEQETYAQETAGKTLAREILSRGGIAPYKRGREKEEYKGIPLVLKNKQGLPLDEMASEMMMDEAGLMRAIHQEYKIGEKKKRAFNWKEYYNIARDALMDIKARELELT